MPQRTRSREHERRTARRTRPRIRFARQILALQIAVVTLVVGVGFTLVGWLLDQQLTDRYEQQALTVARTVAADPTVAAATAAGDQRVVQARAERVRSATHALFVVVTDRNGIRLAHPNPAEIGQHVSTDPSQALSGHEVVNVQRGTLGLSARGKVPVEQGNRIVGEVSVGFAVSDIRASVLQVLGDAALFAVGALLLGVAGSALLARRLKTQTLGLEPHELSELVQEREAVLHGIGEGVLAVDDDGRVSVYNDEAARLLDLHVPPGTPVAEVELPIRLRAALNGQTDAERLMAVAGERVLLVTRRQVRRDNRDLGTVLTLRDRTDLETLTRELDTVRSLSGALRAQRHEFANRLHTLSGLLQTDHHAEAVEYLHALTQRSPTEVGPVPDAIDDPYLQAFLAAKTAEAAESDVILEVADTSWLRGRVVAPVEVTTVLGNLIDNAVRAARLGARMPGRVEVTILADADTLHLSVADSGDGIPTEARQRIFVDGFTTRLSAGHGLGLALARQAARSLGGDTDLADAGGEDRGAVFVAHLPGALVRPEIHR